MWFGPGALVHKGITIVLSLLRRHWLAVVYCFILCSGSCEPVHEDRTRGAGVWMWLRLSHERPTGNGLCTIKTDDMHLFCNIFILQVRINIEFSK